MSCRFSVAGQSAGGHCGAKSRQRRHARTVLARPQRYTVLGTRPGIRGSPYTTSDCSGHGGGEAGCRNWCDTFLLHVFDFFSIICLICLLRFFSFYYCFYFLYSLWFLLSKKGIELTSVSDITLTHSFFICSQWDKTTLLGCGTTRRISASWCTVSATTSRSQWQCTPPGFVLRCPLR